MLTSEKLFKKITETKYLSTDNSYRYRAIMRCFFDQYEKMNYWLYKEDIYDKLINYETFNKYTLDECKQDLESLVSWKNLIPVQDTSKVVTIEEFKNKQFRYRMSEYSVEIERMTIKLENIFERNASLEPSLLERLKNELSRFKEMINKSGKEVSAWWNRVNSDFKQLNDNYKDYISALYSVKADEMMKSSEFLIHKDRFIEYLREFIKELQKNSNAIENILRKISKEETAVILNKIYNYELSVPRLEEIDTSMLFDNIKGRWKSIHLWFLGDINRKSETSKLFDITDEIINKITRYAYQISESRNSAANRKEEYKKLCELFLACESMEEAHKLSALSFGIFNMRHIRCNPNRETESINSSIYEEEPTIVTVKPRVRTYREKAAKSAIKNDTERKLELQKKILKEREEEKEILESYIKEGKIDFKSLPIIDGKTRTAFLRWLTKGLQNAKNQSKTENGRSFRVIKPENMNEKIKLKCKDGNFIMPPYIIEFILE